MRKYLIVLLSILMIMMQLPVFAENLSFSGSYQAQSITEPDVDVITSSNQAGQRADYTIEFTVTDELKEKLDSWTADNPRIIVYFMKNTQNSSKEFITSGVPFSGGFTSNGLNLVGPPSMDDAYYWAGVQSQFDNKPNAGDRITVNIKDVINPVEGGSYQIRVQFRGSPNGYTEYGHNLSDYTIMIYGNGVATEYATITPDNPVAGETTNYVFDLTMLRDSQMSSISGYQPRIYVYLNSSDSNTFWDSSGMTVEAQGFNIANQYIANPDAGFQWMYFDSDRQFYKGDHIQLVLKNVKNPPLPSATPTPRYSITVNVEYEGSEFNTRLNTISKNVASFQITSPGPTLQSFTINPENATIERGNTQQFTAIAGFSDGSSRDVTFESAWSMEHLNIASVSNGLATGLESGFTQVRASYNGLNDISDITVTEPVPTLSNLTVTPESSDILVGGFQQFKATASFSDGSTQDVTNLAIWNIADRSIASVSSGGLATGLKKGITQVSASYNGQNDNANLTVNEPAAPEPILISLSVNPSSAEINVGETQQYEAFSNFSDGTTQDVTNTSTWSISDQSKAIINTSGLTTGISEGSIQVTATYNGLSDSADLTVTAPETPVVPNTLQSFRITPDSATIKVGGNQRYLATASYSDGSTRDVTNESIWEVVDSSIAGINNGLATGKKAGLTIVKASFNGLTDDANLTVTKEPDEPSETKVKIISLQVSPSSVTIKVGESQQFEAVATYSDGSKKNVTDRSEWKIFDPISSINKNGLATGTKEGNTLVQAEFEGLSDTAKLTVIQDHEPEIKDVFQPLPVIIKLVVTPQTSTINEGEAQQFKSEAYFSDGTVMDVTKKSIWSTDKEEVAQITNNGEARGMHEGMTNIEAAFQGVKDKAELYVVKRIPDKDKTEDPKDPERPPVIDPRKPKVPQTGDGPIGHAAHTFTLFLLIMIFVTLVGAALNHKKEGSDHIE